MVQEIVICFLLAILALALYPLPYMIWFRLRHGNSVELEYFPLIGRIWQLGQALKKHGDIVYYRKIDNNCKKNLDIILSNDFHYGHLYMVTSPELSKSVLQNINYYKKMDVDFIEYIGKEGVFFSNQQQWLSHRSFLGKIFNFNLIKKAEIIVEKLCQQEIKDLEKPQNLLELWSVIVGQVIQEIFFGQTNVEFNGKQYCTEIGYILQNVLQFKRLFWMKGLIRRKFFQKPYPSWLLYDVEKDDYKRIQNSIKFLQDMIDSRRKSKSFGTDSLSQYLLEQERDPSIKDVQIIQSYFSLVFAGMDTTSTLTQTCCYLLGQKKDEQNKLRQAFKEDNQDYINGFISEVQRFYNPTISVFLREVTESHYLGKYWIPKGKLLNVSFFENHFNSKFFPKPFEFWPERWYTPGGKDFTESSYAYIPFSAGKRNCIGQHLALIEIKVILKFILDRYEINSKPTNFDLKFLYGLQDPTVVSFKKLNS